MYNQPYQTEISFATGWKIFLTLISIPLTIGFGWLIYDGFTGSTGIFGIICGAIGTLFFCYCVIRVFKEKVIIETDRLIHVRAFTQKEVLYHDIEGYRVDDNYIYLESFQTKKTVIKLSTYLGKSKILKILSQNFKDLDVRDRYRSEQDIINNNDYGVNPEDAAAHLKKTKRLCISLNVAGVALALWVGFFPDQTSIILNILFPVAMLIVVMRSKGLIRVDTSKHFANPNIAYAFMGPLCALSIRCVFDLHIFSFENVWLYVIGAFLPLVALTFTGSKEFGFKDKAQTSNTILLTVFLFLFCLIDVLMINSNFDSSTPRTYKAEVLNKRISKGNKSTSYYLQLSAWGPQKQIDENTVKSSFYSDVEVGDTVSVNYYKGLMNIPWFDIVK